MPDQPNPDARAKLISTFSSAKGTKEHGERWDSLWAEGFIPWDKGFPSPALVDLLSDRQDLVPPPSAARRKKALVPGCGAGYDILLLASYGYDAYGLEISSKALEKAGRVESEEGGTDYYKARSEVKGSVTWIVGDLFDDAFLKDVGADQFDLIYDYTFLCALPPSMRPAWSERFNHLLAPEGRLVCVEFPTYKPHATGGPPWALPPKVYLAHLSRPGQELPYNDEHGLLENELGEPREDGLVRIAHFQPQRTHEIGYDADGKVTDWVSVWEHPH